MSISAALSSAASGLTVTGRAAATVSMNIANAMTPGYAARQLELSSAPYGGVSSTGVSRRETAAVLSARREADANAAGINVRLGAANKVADAIGRAEDPDSLSAKVAAFSASLTSAASQPGSTVRLQNVLTAATRLSDHVNQAGQAIQDERLTVEKGIAKDVNSLNEGLSRLETLNKDIIRAAALGQDTNSLLDQRRRTVDTISDLVPVKEMPRDDGSIALVTENGAILIDGKAGKIGFTEMPAMTPAMTLGSPLSGLTLNGRPIDITKGNHALAGGSIAAKLEIRDEALPAAQEKMDAFARDMIERFSEAGLDSTLAPGAAGLFTEAGSALTVPAASGLAQRLSVNPAVDPASGGALYRLRDGLGAAAPGPSGEARFLHALGDALDSARLPSNPSLGTSSQSAGGLAGSLVSGSTASAYALSNDLGFAEARATTFRDAELSEGVDTDDELRTLMLIEKSYAANARVIQVANSMLDRLMEI